jgi:hypothetical protein
LEEFVKKEPDQTRGPKRCARGSVSTFGRIKHTQDMKPPQTTKKQSRRRGVAMGVCIAIGIGIGAAVGAAMQNEAMGVALGTAFGVAVGALLTFTKAKRD